MDAVLISLIRRCKNNDEEAFNKLLSQYEGYLYRICYSFTYNKEESLDMMQEVYIKLFRAINSFDETRPLLPWLKKIAVNTIINYRKKRRIPEISLDFSPEDFLASKEDTEDIVLFGDTRDVVDRLIAELPEQYRMALILRYHEEMSYEHIADTLVQPLGTVKNSVFRARNLLRKRMQSCGLLEV
ncbi:MAG: RNA polymerase sigma factor [Bacillota bacterium]|nr:RNA polymerase sigma factor [Bacillota bacterium]